MHDFEPLQKIDYLVLVLYFIGVLAVGFWVSFRKGGTEDLFLGGRQIRWWTVGFSIFGTNVSPGMLIASCAASYEMGMVPANFEWLAWMFLLLLAMVFAPHYLNTKICTMPEFLERRYSSGCRKFLSFYVLFTTIVLWLGGTLFAGAVLFQQIVGWPMILCIVFLTVISMSFTITGGLNAVAATDTFQSILMIGGSATLALISFNAAGGLEGLQAHVPDHYWKLFRPYNDAQYPWPAIVLGYPVLGIWFWCTDQTIVQRVLGARTLTHGQGGSVFAGFLKILTPIIYFMPGIFLFVINPNLGDSKRAYMTLVNDFLPTGMPGLMAAVLVAALISTITAGLNSFSTVFTLDIYINLMGRASDPRRNKRVGQVTTLAAGLVAIAVAYWMTTIEFNMFDLFQAVIGYMAPPMVVVFLAGVLWRRANAFGALWTLIFGSVVCIAIGMLNLNHWPSEAFWKPWYLHFMMICVYLVLVLGVFMIILSLATAPPPPEKMLPSLADASRAEKARPGLIWTAWGVLAAIMAWLYWFFN